jgi:hypothetical protein
MATKQPAKKQPAKPAAKAAKETSSELAVRKENLPVNLPEIDLEGDAGAGFENADKDTFAIPFLRILQSNSPQCKKSHELHIEGAEEGDFFNTVTKEIFKGELGITLVPVHYDRKFVEWAPNRGGYRGEHLPSAPVLQRAQLKEDDEGKQRLTLPSGNTVSDTRYHFCIHVKPDGGYSPVLVCMSSSGIKKSKQMMTELNSIKAERANGGKFTPPMFLNKVLMGHVVETKGEDSWYNYDPVLDGFLDVRGDANEAEIYLAAKAFRDQIASGDIRVDHAEMGGVAGTDDGDEGNGNKF